MDTSTIRGALSLRSGTTLALIGALRSGNPVNPDRVRSEAALAAHWALMLIKRNKVAVINGKTISRY